MKLVKCINERTTYPGQLSIGARYWMDEDSVWKDEDGDEYAVFYTFHIPNAKYKLGQFKTSHFEIEHNCVQCIYSTYPKDCKKICIIVEGKEKFKIEDWR